MIAASVTLGGCVIGSSSQSPQSHFAFPNSNVIPIGEAKGSKSKLCGLFGITWGASDGDDQDAATREALDRSGGDILINVRTDNRLFTAMLFAICTTKVRGTAAKMEIGRQQLGPMSGPQPVPPPVVSPATPPKGGGCTSDQECKAGRICRDGACVNP